MINSICLILKSPIIQIDKTIKSLTVNSDKLIYYILKRFKMYILFVCNPQYINTIHYVYTNKIRIF